MGIPADVTVGLAVNAVASAVTSTLFQAVTGAFFFVPVQRYKRECRHRQGKG